MIKVLTVFGTRPEAIKMAPLILRAKNHPAFNVKICLTGQHREMLYQVMDFFCLKPDYDLRVMRHTQSLYNITADIIKGLEPVFAKEVPDIVIVQGDTTTAFAGALSAFYQKIPVAHLEAGLRSHNKFSPFPEEINRILVGHLADMHFAPTLRAKENLIKEGIQEGKIYIVGNTVIDALFLTLDIIKKQEEKFRKYFEWLNEDNRVIVVTGHRRESFGEPFREICLALKDVVEENNDVVIVYPVHLNPKVREPVFEILKGVKNVHLIEPLDYPHLVWLMNRSCLIVTDSGGIQEEAPSLGKPVLVTRDVTERVEGVEAGTCMLVGTKRADIVANVNNLLQNGDSHKKMVRAVNPYGDGRSSETILNYISSSFGSLHHES